MPLRAIYGQVAGALYRCRPIRELWGHAEAHSRFPANCRRSRLGLVLLNRSLFWCENPVTYDQYKELQTGSMRYDIFQIMGGLALLFRHVALEG
jgi:hypothetical protein